MFRLYVALSFLLISLSVIPVNAMEGFDTDGIDGTDWISTGR